jgi:uncharacterized membrane protein YeiB
MFPPTPASCGDPSTVGPRTEIPSPRRAPSSGEDPRAPGGGLITTADSTSKGRVTGVDVARCLAVIAMFAEHVFGTLDDDGNPALGGIIEGGRSAATFALVAGVSIAIVSGGRSTLHGRARTAASASAAVRAVVIGVIGLLLGLVTTDIDVILTFFAVMFLFALPLPGLRTRSLALLSVAFLALGPVLLVALHRAGLPFADVNPTPVTLATDPVGVLLTLLFTGEYPVVVYMTYLCAGIAIGRLDLTSRRVAGWLLGGGIALAVTARVVSWVLLYPLGGLQYLLPEAQAQFGSDLEESTVQLIWTPEQQSSWWYLALSGPQAHSSLDVAGVLGAAMAILGASLLLMRNSVASRLLDPVRAAGMMTLTLYSAHILVLETGLLEDYPTALFLVLVAASLVFAVLWLHRHRQGPLEWVVTLAANGTRRAVLARPGTPARHAARRRGIADH